MRELINIQWTYRYKNIVQTVDRIGNIVRVLILVLLLIFCSVTGAGDVVTAKNENKAEEQNYINQVDEDNYQRMDQTQDFSLPDKIELMSKKVEFSDITYANELDSFNEVKVEALGRIDETEINIKLISDEDSNIHGVFQYLGKEYFLNYLGYAQDIDSIVVYELQLDYLYNGESMRIVSCIGSSIVGYTYLVYDEANDKWLSFHNWGTPQAIDINQDGVKEVVLQFAGLHLNTPNVNILSFKNRDFILTDVNEEVSKMVTFDANIYKISSILTNETNDKPIIQITDNRSEEDPGLYCLVCDQDNYILNRID